MPPKNPRTQVSMNAAWREKQRRISVSKNPSTAKLKPTPVLRIPTRRLSLWRWGNELFASSFTLPSAPFHRRLADALEEIIRDGGQKAFCFPRGSAKTTWLRIAGLYALLEGLRHYLALIAGNADEAEKVLGVMKGYIEMNPGLAARYPGPVACVRAISNSPQKALRLQDEAGESLAFEWKKEIVRFPPLGKSAGAIIQAKGVDGHLRGLNLLLPDGSNVRPDIIFLDDPQTREDASSPTTITKLEDAVKGDLLGLAGPDVSIAALVAGTIIKRGDLMARLTDRKLNPSWQGERISLLMREPAAKDTLWKTYAALRKEAQEAGDKDGAPANAFYLANRSAMDADAECYWKARFILKNGEISALQHAMNLRIDRGEGVFAAEYQNAPLETSTALYAFSPESVLKRSNARPELALPPLQASVTAAVDLNRYGLSWCLLASTQTLASSILSYGVFAPDGMKIYEGKRNEFSEAEKLAFWRALDALMTRFASLKLLDQQGRPARLRRVGVDAGYLYQTVRQFCSQNAARWTFELFPTRGRAHDQFAPYGANVQRKGDSWIEVADKDGSLIVFDVDVWKETNQQAFLLPPGAPSSLDLWGDRERHKELAAHVAAEKCVGKTELSKGGLKYEWTVSGRNDLLEALNGARVMASVGGCNPIIAFAAPPSPPVKDSPRQDQSAPAAPPPSKLVSYDSMAW